MYLRIDKIELENIRCFDNISLSFSEGVNVITGPNGAGKSTIITSIGFGLYGNDYLVGSNIQISDLIRRDAASGKIKLTFSTHEGTFISDYFLRETKSDIWKLFKKGVTDPIAQTITDTRTVIQSLLGTKIDHYTFKTALCSRQGELTELLDASPSRRSDQIKKILGLDNFDRTEAVLNRFHKKVVDEIDKLEGQLVILLDNKIDLKEVNSEIEETKKKTTDIKNKQKTVLAKKKNIEKKTRKMVSQQERINYLQEEVKNQKEEVGKLQKLLKEEKTQLDQFKQQLELDETSKENITNLLQKLNEKFTKYSLHFQEIDQKLQHYQKLSDGITDLDEEIEGIRRQLKKTENELETCLNRGSIEEQEEELTELKSTYSQYEENRKALKNQITSLQETINERQSRKKKLEMYNNSVTEEFTTKFDGKMSEISDLISNKTEERDARKSHLDQMDTNISNSREKLGNIQGKLDSIAETLELLDTTDLDHNCPICDQSLENVNKDELIQHHQSELSEYQEEMKKIEQVMQRQKNAISQTEKTIEQLDQQITELLRFKDRHEQVVQNLKELESIREKNAQDQEKLDEVQERWDELARTDPKTLKQEIDNLDQNIKKGRKLTQQVADYKKEILLKTETLTEKQDEHNKMDPKQLREDVVRLKEAKSQSDKKIKLINTDVMPTLEKYQKHQDELERIRQELGKLNKELEKKQRGFDKEELEEAQNTLNNTTEQLGYFEAELNNLNQKLVDIKEKKKKAKEQAELVDDYDKRLNRLYELDPLSKTIRKIMEEAPELLISKTTSKISNYLTNMIKRLLPDQGFHKAIFQNDGDVHIFGNNQRIDKNTLSGGERTVLALALRLALADYVAPLQFLTLDEPTNHLDAQRVGEFIEIIDREQLFSHSKGQLLLVTHREEFDRNAQESIKLEINEGNRQLLEASSE